MAVTGGAGFLGSHLCDVLVGRGDEVVCVDDLCTGRLSNVEHLRSERSFAFLRHDVTEPFDIAGDVDAILHLASPASPRDYLEMPIETLLVGSAGTRNALELASAKGARLVLASTSEVYGDPLEHPQAEDYWGNVNPVGPRGVYDEAKRFGEALTMAYHRHRGLDTGIARIFNTFGPRMRPDDGRAISNFIVQALRGEPLTVYGTGEQTRSFCYVDDQIRGLVALLDSDEHDPINIGNPTELSVLEIATLVIDVCGSSSPVVHMPLPVDDPVVRRPVIERAQTLLGWSPLIPVADGLALTVEWLRQRIDP
ncbi:MAG: SDR family oxidoreductase [Acidimicrobiales bacterium]